MAEIRFEKATLEHAEALAVDARPDDYIECVSAGFAGVADAVAKSLEISSDASAVFFDGRLACVFGVAPDEGNGLAPPRTNIWLLTSTTVDEYPVAFWRLARQVVAAVLQRHGSAWALTHARHSRAMRFLQALGFKASSPAVFGPHDELFCLVSISR